MSAFDSAGLFGAIHLHLVCHSEQSEGIQNS